MESNSLMRRKKLERKATRSFDPQSSKDEIDKI